MKFRYLVVGCLILIAAAFLVKIFRPTPALKKTETKNTLPVSENIIFEDKSWQKLTKQVVAGGAQYSSSYSIKIFPGWKAEHRVTSNKSDILSITTSSDEELRIIQHDIGGVGCAFPGDSDTTRLHAMMVHSFIEITTQSGDLLRVAPRSDIDGITRVCWKRPQGDWLTDADFGTVVININPDSSQEVKFQIYSMLSSVKKIENRKK